MRRLVTPIALGLVLLSSTVARAEDPLLSGYGGPGGGEQVVLGSKLIGGSKGSGSLRAASSVPRGGGAVGAQPDVGGQAPVVGGAGPDVTSRSPGVSVGSGARSSAGGAGGSEHSASGGDDGAKAGAVAAPAAAALSAPPAAEPAAARGSSRGDLPLSTTDLVLILAGFGAALIAGIAAVRVQRTWHRL
jgi:hypothetical protein